jgi:uncharacterized protein YhaN
MQAGLECIGDIDDYCVAEVLTLAAKSLDTVSSDYVIDVSHLGIISTLADSLSLSGDGRNKLISCIGEKNTHGIDSVCRAEGADENIAEISVRLLLERIEQLSAAVAEQNRNRDLLVQDLSRLSSIREEKKYWQERLVRCRERAGLLDDTVNYLYQARENLQTGYLQPLRESFSGYMETLAGEDGGGILMTPELEVQLERAGQSRRMGYFSAGQTDLVLLCMRFALVDALFARQRPLVILDDPFVNLDDAHMALALRMLQVLAEDRQILYMTCSESRSPK